MSNVDLFNFLYEAFGDHGWNYDNAHGFGSEMWSYSFVHNKYSPHERGYLIILAKNGKGKLLHGYWSPDSETGISIPETEIWAGPLSNREDVDSLLEFIRRYDEARNFKQC